MAFEPPPTQAITVSGDFFPNSYNLDRGDKYKESEFQKFWLQEKLPDIVNLTKFHPFLYIIIKNINSYK